MPRPFITGYQGLFNPGQTVSIVAGQQESRPFSCGGLTLSGIFLPNIFTGTSISFLTADSIDGFQAEGQIILDTLPDDQDSVTINDVVIKFVVEDPQPADNEVLIEANVELTARNLYDFLRDSEDENLLACTYYNFRSNSVSVTAVYPGLSGNSVTFDKSSSHITLAPASGVLSGGGFRPLYDASNTFISMTVAQGRCYAVDSTKFQGIEFLKIKSGSAEVSFRNILCLLKGL